MTDRYPLVLAVLIYVTLDLSMPGMPGAFVFECEDSVEGARIRSRSAAETAAPPGLIRDKASASVPVPVHFEAHERPTPHVSAPRQGRRVVGRPPRAQTEYPRSSEDPH